VALDLTELVAPAHTALVLQEVQNGVVGSPSALPALAQAAADVQLVEHCARLARVARTLDIPVIHCTFEALAGGRGMNSNARLFAGIRKSDVHQTQGSAAVQVPDAIGVEPGDVLLPRHHGVGPMTGTQLDSLLRNLGTRTIVGVGVSINIGMTNLAFDAVNRGYQMVMPRDAIAGVPSDYADAVVELTLTLVATITTTEEIVRAWQST
jgi:nicotinamidase-related amidase